MRGFGDRDRSAVHHVDHRRKQEPGRKGRDEGQEPDRTKWPPGREQEADREGEIPRTDFVRDVDRRALVAPVHQTGYGKRELGERNRDKPEPQHRDLAETGMPLFSCRRQDARRQIGAVRPLLPYRLTKGARILDEVPTGRAAVEVVGQDGRWQRGVLAVEQRRTRFTDGAAIHAPYVAARTPRVPENPRLVCLASGVTDDLQLVRSAIAGDRLALAAIVRETQPHVWRYCAYLGRGTDVDDLVQDTYLRALRSLERYEGRSSLRTWLLSIARRVCADAVRAARRRRALDALFAREHFVADPGDRVAYAMLVDSLAPERREAFVLTQIVGLSYADAAEVCRVPVGTIRSRVARARDQLHAQISEETA